MKRSEMDGIESLSLALHVFQKEWPLQYKVVGQNRHHPLGHFQDFWQNKMQSCKELNHPERESYP